MKKILLGTTALVAAAALASPASAGERIQLGLSGYHIGGISYTDGDFNDWWSNEYYGSSGSSSGIDDYNEINFGSDSEIHFSGMTTLDNGLEISFRAELELEDDGEVDSDADNIDEVYIQFDGGFGRLQFGQNDSAMYQQHISAPNTFMGHKVTTFGARLDPFAPLGFGGWGNSASPISTHGGYSGDNIKLTYFTPDFSGFQFGVSYTPNPCKNDTGYTTACVSGSDEHGRHYWEGSVAWQIALDNVELAFSGGYGQGESGDSGNEPSEWTLGAELDFGGFTLGGSYRDTNTSTNDTLDSTHWDVGVTYETGPWGFTLNYADMETDWTGDEEAWVGSCYYDDTRCNMEANSWLAGVTYKYGPGMQIGFGLMTLDSSETYEDTDWAGYGESYFSGEGFEGTSFFIENSIWF